MLAFYPLSCTCILQKCKFTSLFQICMHQKTELTYPTQFALLLGLLGIAIILSGLVLLALGSVMLHVPMDKVAALLSGSQHVGIARFLNTVASFLVFCIPALVLAMAQQKNPFQFLGLHSRLTIKQCLLVVLIAFTGLILSGALGEINQAIWLPAKWLIKAKELEASYKQTMMAMATMHSFSEYLIALFVMAFSPALFEEILFRGGFQQIFVGWARNAFLGILITSVLFSAIHFSFFGFLPRLALGLILGYVFYYSKNLWLNVLMHFLYNGIIVTQLYLATKKGQSIDKVMDESMPIWWGLIATLGMYALLQLFKKESEFALAESAINSSEISLQTHESVAEDL